MTRWAKSGLQFPWLLVGSIGLWAAVLVLAGCGDEKVAEPLESNFTVTQVNGVVDTSTGGQPLSLDNLTVRTSVGSSRVGTDGRVSTKIFEQGPQYAELLDSRGRTVMLAFASPGEPDISALSTAKALTYLALAGAWMKEEGRLKLLDEADMVTGFLPLLAAVKSELAAKGYLDLEAASIQSAIGSIASAYGSASGSSAHVRPLGVLATPTTASGLSLDTSVDDKLTVQNVYLRRVSLFFRRVSHVPAAGTEVDENNAFTRIDLENVARYSGITGTLDSFIKGEVAYSPVSSEPLDIPIHPVDAKKTTYQIFAIGPGFSSNQNLNVPADIIAAQEYLEIKAMFLDVFMVLVANVALPLAGDQIDEYLEFAAANAVISDIIGNLKSTVPDMWDKMVAGQWDEAAWSLFNSGYTSNTILPAVAQLTLDFLWKNTSISADNYEMLFNGMKGMLDKMGKIDIVLNVADTLLVFRDIARSKRIEHFLVTTTPGKVTLAAGQRELTVAQSTTISATIQNRDPNGVYEFNWSVAPRSNYWLDDRRIGTDDNSAGILVTSEGVVDIRSLVQTNGAATVTCKVYRLDGERREVGEDNITITFTGSNRVAQDLDNFQTVATVFQQTNGKWTSVTGTYIDLPRSVLALQYTIGRQREGTIATWGIFVTEPPAKVEYFEYSDDRPSAGALAVLGGQVPGGYIRWWAGVLEWTDKNTSAAAQTTAESFRTSQLNYAKARPVYFETLYR